MITNLPEHVRNWVPTEMFWSDIYFQVSDEDIEEMFTYADKDSDGKISYKEFQAMINPPKPPLDPQPHLVPTIIKRVTIKTTSYKTEREIVFNTDTVENHVGDKGEQESLISEINKL
jgi:hypothetical protein